MASNTTHATATAAAMVDAWAARIDGGGTAASVVVYSGSQPATPETAATGTLLVTLVLNYPACTASTGANSRSLDVSTAISAAAAAAGTAGYARVVRSDGVAVSDLTVGATGSGAGVELSSLTFTSGQTVNLTGGTFTQPLN